MSSYAREELEKLAIEARERGVAVRTLVAQGKPSLEIIRTAREESADMIVLGTHGKGMLDQALFGSTTERVVRKAPCPVLSVRATAHDFVGEQEPVSDSRLLVDGELLSSHDGYLLVEEGRLALVSLAAGQDVLLAELGPGDALGPLRTTGDGTDQIRVRAHGAARVVALLAMQRNLVAESARGGGRAATSVFREGSTDRKQQPPVSGSASLKSNRSK